MRKAGIALVVEYAEERAVVGPLVRRVDARPPLPVTFLIADTRATETRHKGEASSLVLGRLGVVRAEDLVFFCSLMALALFANTAVLEIKKAD